MERERRRREIFTLCILGIGWAFLVAHTLRERDIRWLQLLFLIFAIYGSLLFLTGLVRGPRARTLGGSSETYRPFVSILVPAKNEEKVIGEAIKHLCFLDYPDARGARNYEVIVIEDRSTDGTGAILENLQKWYPFKVIRPPLGSNHGKAAALNVGLRACRGEVVAVFDADAIVPRDFLKKTVPYLNSPVVAAVQARKLVSNGRRNLLTRVQEDEYAIFQVLLQRSRSLLGGYVSLAGNGMVLRREVLEAVGGWNERALTEDLEMTLRLTLRGWQIRYCEEAVVWEEAVGRWKSLFLQRARWTEGALQCFFQYLPNLLFQYEISWVRRLDALFFYSSALLLPVALLTSYLYAVVSFLEGERFSLTLPEPALTLGSALFTASAFLSILQGIGDLPRAIVAFVRFGIFTISQLVATLLALAHYLRSLWTGRIEWVKTEHEGASVQGFWWGRE
ncbi:MAG: glycosyltransferase family 2 protein [Armatimonadota bacterium]|nr:glycosyltransferase family 2 protein [Armatimonadota bacterium]